MKNRGFTLLETILYIGLFSLLLTSALTVMWQLVRSMDDTTKHSTIIEEGNFVLRKINRALTNTTFIAQPSLATPTTTTFVLTQTGSSKPITIRFNAASSSVEMQENDRVFEPLTTSNVSVGELMFTYEPAVGAAPPGIKAAVTINGILFETEHFVRK